jgi:thymidylate kinase
MATAGWAITTLRTDTRSATELREPGFRERFVSRVARALSEAGVEYVVLHGHEPDAAPGSDLDVAVVAPHRRVVDVLARSGAFGLLVSRTRYDVPSCVTYVVEASDGDQRYRKLDVACDPFGVSRLGPAVPLALGNVEWTAETPVLSPAAQTCFLAAKRACEGVKRSGDLAALRRSYERDRDGAARILGEAFGEAGRSLSSALATERDLTQELGALQSSIRRSRSRGRRSVTLARFATGRALERALRPVGLAIVLVGPDGSGKSTLATRLEVAALGPFRRVVRLHLRPGLLPPPARLLRRGAADPAEPHARKASGALGSLARVAYLWLDSLLGWPRAVWLPQVRASLVVIERGWLDLAVDPGRYRLSTPPRLVRTLGRLLPRPDLTLLLDAPAAAAHDRKAELPVAEIDRQLALWRRAAAGAPARYAVLDAWRNAEEVAQQALDALSHRLAQRNGDWSSCALALRCLGGVSTSGKAYALIRLRGHPRWLLPARVGAAGPRRAGLYRPAVAAHVGGAVALEAVQRVRLRAHLRVEPTRGLLPAIEELLGLGGLELAAAAPREGHPPTRALVSVLRAGRPVAFAKVDAENGARLRHERRVLELLDGRTRSFAAPRPLGLLDWQGCTVLVLSALAAPGFADRELGHLERDALVELATLAPDLSAALGAADELVPIHGDFAAWNSAPLRDRLSLWDWEAARLGLPLEDAFHWRLQRLILFGRGSLEQLVGAATRPDAELAALAAACGAAAETAPAALRAALAHGLEDAPERAAAIRRRGLLLLDEAMR